MRVEAPSVITQQFALLVEGRDEVNFFGALLKHIGISNVLVRDVGGVSHFPTKFPAALLSPGFRENVKAYAIIRDADVSADAAFRSVRDLLKREKQPFPTQRDTYVAGPPKVGIYIMPGNAENGMLESLCLATVENDPRMHCADDYMSCIKGHTTWETGRAPENGIFPNNEYKAKAKSFLAGHKKDLPSVGIAALAGVWDFDHQSMKPLTEFLLALAA